MDLSWIIVVGVIIGMLVGWAIGTSRGRPVLGTVLGLFGLVGWVVMFFVPRPNRFAGADEYDLHDHDPHRPDHPADGAVPRTQSEPPDSPPS